MYCEEYLHVFQYFLRAQGLGQMANQNRQHTVALPFLQRAVHSNKADVDALLWLGDGTYAGENNIGNPFPLCFPSSF